MFTGTIADGSVQHFLDLKPVTKLSDFIQIQNFLGKQFQKSKLICSGQTLNKILKGITTDSAIEEHSREENSCLIWLALTLRSMKIVTKTPPKPAAPTAGLKMHEFTVLCTGPINTKCASEYFDNPAYVNLLKTVVKG